MPETLLMFKRLAAIVLILFCTSIAWVILGSTIFLRTYGTPASSAEHKVMSTWGAPQEQTPPSATYDEQVTKTNTQIIDGRSITRTETDTITHPLPLEGSSITVRLDLEHRQKGLLWFSTYKVAFAGDYIFRNTSDRDQNVAFTLTFPVAQAMYDDLAMTVDGATLPLANQEGAARVAARLPAGKTAKLHVGYRSQGLDWWRYRFGAGVAQVRDFDLRMTTNFPDIDFPDNTLSPATKRRTGDGWDLNWHFTNTMSGFQIGMAMPEKAQPGPLAGQISYFAPVSLLFFFFVMFLVTTLRRIELHPMNYFFLAAAFFAFHLLLAYLVDHISIHLAFVISALVSMFLVVSYLRLVVGMRFAAVEAAGAQFLYLVLFSYAFFLKGFTGLAVTIGSVVTLFVAMQLTGRIRWAERFARPPAV